jgi:hypothetical protein
MSHRQHGGGGGGGGGGGNGRARNSDGLLPQIQERRFIEQVAGRYNGNLDIQTCYNQLPQVPCGGDGDCARWVAENCSQEDQISVVPVCDLGGMCAFAPLPG